MKAAAERSPLWIHYGISRRRFLRQSFAFSALAGLSSAATWAGATPSTGGAADLLMIGDWGYDDEGHTGQSSVATGMQHYIQRQALRPEALLLLGDNWYREQWRVTSG